LNFSDIRNVHKVLLYTKRNGSSGWSLKTMTPTGYAEGNVIRIPDAPKRFDVLKVITENVWGNKSLPQFMFLHKPAEPGGHVKLGHTIEPDFIRVTLHAQHAFTAMPRVIVYEGETRQTITLTALDIDKYVGTFVPLDSYSGIRRLVADAEVNGAKTSALDEFELFPIPAGKRGTITADGGNLLITYDSTSVFKTVFMQIEKDIEPEDHEIFYSLSPGDVVLRGDLGIAVAAKGLTANDGLFFSGLSGWELLDKFSPKDSTTILRGTISRTLGEIAIRNDDTPPAISHLSITRLSSRRPSIAFRYGDNFSGVEYQELKTYIDGVAVIPEVDGEHHKATYDAPHPLERGSHRLTIRIQDKMGNSNVTERQFTVR